MKKPYYPLFSVLIANYNNGHFLEECLQSVYKQEYTNWEIIIVDDKSSDKSAELYEELIKDNRIKIFYNEVNRGCGYTKRRCVEEASGEILGFLDSDDALTSDALLKMVEAHENNPEISLVHSTYYLCDEFLNIRERFKYVSQADQDNSFFFNLEYNIKHFTSFKRSFYLKTEGIDSYLRRAVDQDLYLKLYEVGNTLFIDLPLYYYRIHKEGISTMANAEKAFFWHWIVIVRAARRRNIDMKYIEDLFYTRFIDTRTYYDIYYKYKGLKKYEKLNNFMSRVKTNIKKLFSAK